MFEAAFDAGARGYIRTLYSSTCREVSFWRLPLGNEIMKAYRKRDCHDISI
jgi:hypothetical protein